MEAIMAEQEYLILTDYKLEGCILDIINESKKYCILVTPFFDATEYWGHLTRTLEDASEGGKKVLFVLTKPNGKEIEKGLEKKERVIAELNGKYNFDLFFVENLHSKIYLNENAALITSMNLVNYSKNYNHEIGFFTKKSEDLYHITNDIIFNEILKSENKEHIEGKYAEWLKRGRFLDDNVGYCLSCRDPIPFSENNPFCSKCYESKKPAKHCHKCHQEFQSISLQFPLCKPCWDIVHKGR
jgi:hypothetical protein